MIDVGAEDWEFPDASTLSVVEAGKLWDHIQKEAKEANKRAVRLKERKAMAKAVAAYVVEATGQTSARVPLDDGREIQITPYTWDVYAVKDKAAFVEWDETQSDESFYDDTPRLRDQLFQDEMRRRVRERQPLPPGVVLAWTDTKLSVTAVPSRKRKHAVEVTPES